MVWSRAGREAAIVFLSGLLVACGQSRRNVDGGKSGDAGAESMPDAGGGGQAGSGALGGAGSGEAQGGEAGVVRGGNGGSDGGGSAGAHGGADSVAGAGGAGPATCDIADVKIGADHAENAAAASPLVELELPGAWEALALQIFATDPNVAGVERSFAFRGGELWGELPSGFGGIRSAVTRDDEFFYTYTAGSGVVRAHVVRLSLAGCELQLLQSGGYTRTGHVDLFLLVDIRDIVAQSGTFIAFNHWQDAEFFGRLVDTETSLALADAAGTTIEPSFPPP